MHPIERRDRGMRRQRRVTQAAVAVAAALAVAFNWAFAQATEASAEDSNQSTPAGGTSGGGALKPADQAPGSAAGASDVQSGGS